MGPLRAPTGDSHPAWLGNPSGTFWRTNFGTDLGPNLGPETSLRLPQRRPKRHSTQYCCSDPCFARDTLLVAPRMPSYVELGVEEGCVAMVHGINNDVLNCNHLFNLFCLYGNIIKIKILDSRSGIGMVQYADKLSTEMAVRYLNNLHRFFLLEYRL